MPKLIAFSMQWLNFQDSGNWPVITGSIHRQLDPLNPAGTDLRGGPASELKKNRPGKNLHPPL